MLFSAIFSMNAIITITHAYFSALKIAVSLESSLNPRPGGLGFKQLPRATAIVKKTCMIHIFEGANVGMSGENMGKPDHSPCHMLKEVRCQCQNIQTFFLTSLFGFNNI